MDWNRIIPWTWRRYLVAILIMAGASVLRVVFFGGLGRGTAYLTYYPTVMLAALTQVHGFCLKNGSLLRFLKMRI